MLQACFEHTEWSVLEAAVATLDEMTDTVASYISANQDPFLHTSHSSQQTSDSFVRPKS